MYLKRKGSIAGPTFKIPLMGPFLQAIDPKFESYLAQWASGPLSCVSIFHKCVNLLLFNPINIIDSHIQNSTDSSFSPPTETSLIKSSNPLHMQNHASFRLQKIY